MVPRRAEGGQWARESASLRGSQRVAFRSRRSPPVASVAGVIRGPGSWIHPGSPWPLGAAWTSTGLIRRGGSFTEWAADPRRRVSISVDLQHEANGPRRLGGEVPGQLLGGLFDP